MHSRAHAFLTHPLAASSLATWQAIIPNQLCTDRDFSVFSPQKIIRGPSPPFGYDVENYIFPPIVW